MSENTENHDLITAAQSAVEPHNLNDGIVLAHESLRLVDFWESIEKRRDRPSRKSGTRSFDDVVGFVDYHAKHHDPETTEVYATLELARITAVLNSHSDTYAGWGDHRAVLQLRPTQDWIEWNERNEKWFKQGEFAEFVEKHLTNFAIPDGATVLEMAQEFRANSSVRFDSSQRVKSGQTRITYHETIEAKAGVTGAIDIPDVITLAMQVYEFGESVGFTARLRYRISDGTLHLGYLLDRPNDVLRAAFEDVCDQVREGINGPVWLGRTA